MGASVSHYLLETSRVVFQVRPTLLLTPCQLPKWERGRSHCRGWELWSLSLQACIPQDLSLLLWDTEPGHCST